MDCVSRLRMSRKRRRGFALLPWTLTIVIFLTIVSMGFYGVAYVNWRSAERFWGTMQARLAADSLLREAGEAINLMLNALGDDPGKGYLFVLQRMTGESGSDEGALRAVYEEIRTPDDPTWDERVTTHMTEQGMSREEAVAALTQNLLKALEAGDVPQMRQVLDGLFAKAEAAAAGGSTDDLDVGLSGFRTVHACAIYAGLAQAQGIPLTKRIQLTPDKPWVVGRGGGALETTLTIDMPATDDNGKWKEGDEVVVTCSAAAGQWRSGNRTLIFKRMKVKDPATGEESFYWGKGLDILRGVRM